MVVELPCGERERERRVGGFTRPPPGGHIPCVDSPLLPSIKRKPCKANRKSRHAPYGLVSLGPHHWRFQVGSSSPVLFLGLV
ncbi:hypothetical protein BHE74_00022493 [Ensete ventricosum]|nr:hypothetical protein BHE74_00022493 [Ensete ventricosum]